MVQVCVGEAVDGEPVPLTCGRPPSPGPPSRTASAKATRSSSSGLVGSGPAWRTSSHPGRVMLPAWPTHRSHESVRARWPVDRPPPSSRVNERQRCHRVVRTPCRQHRRGTFTIERLSCGNAAEAPDTRNRSARDVQPLPSARGRFAQLPANGRLEGRSGSQSLDTGQRGGAAICADHCCRRRCRAGAAGPSGSTCGAGSL